MQSASVLHSTHVPAMFGFDVLPHTNADGSLSVVQSVPVGAGVKLGASGFPVQDGLVSQAEVEVGMLVASSTDVTLPLPLHTSFWQSPAVCEPFGSAVPAGTNTVPQTLAVHVGVEQNVAAGQSATVLHWTQPSAALQTLVEPEQVCGVPATQAFETQVAAGVNVAPLQLAAEQSVLALHWTQPTAALQRPSGPAHGFETPATQRPPVHAVGGV